MNVENLELFAGDDRTFTLHGRDARNNAASLTGKTVQWLVGCPPRSPADFTSIFTKVGTITVAASGTFTVAVDSADTLDLVGDYLHMAKSSETVSGDVAVIVSGRFRVRPALVT